MTTARRLSAFAKSHPNLNEVQLKMLELLVLVSSPVTPHQISACCIPKTQGTRRSRLTQLRRSLSSIINEGLIKESSAIGWKKPNPRRREIMPARKENTIACPNFVWRPGDTDPDFHRVFHPINWIAQSWQDRRQTGEAKGFLATEKARALFADNGLSFESAYSPFAMLSVEKDRAYLHRLLLSDFYLSLTTVERQSKDPMRSSRVPPGIHEPVVVAGPAKPPLTPQLARLSSKLASQTRPTNRFRRGVFHDECNAWRSTVDPVATITNSIPIPDAFLVDDHGNPRTAIVIYHAGLDHSRPCVKEAVPDLHYQGLLRQFIDWCGQRRIEYRLY